MKSRTWCACVIAMLLVSTVAFGEILDTGDWYGVGDVAGDWEYSSASAHADGDDYDVTSYGDGWQYTYTTEAGTFYWTSYVYVWAEVKMWLWNNETCDGFCIAYAKAVNPFGTDQWYGTVDVTRSGDLGELVDEWYGVNDTYNSWYAYFDAYYDGIDAEHTAYTQASVPEDGDSSVHSHSDAWAWGDLSDYP